ncbi:universal stress protein PHOS32-like [Corylus avellana]|uniref:universal stress protein PHOS32-like n=1 Tax=Corylus avellana TaxID=13451 RepID=UPI00286B1BBF|nr:universal stress protein PHOS32-like [Corylus avellana]
MAKNIPVMLVAVDESEHSFYALEWTLDHFFAPNVSHSFKLHVIHARPSPASLLGMGGIGSGEFVTILETDLKRTATRTIEKAKAICRDKSVDNVSMEIVEGDPRNVLCDAVERNRAPILVLGSHGYGVVKRAVLGSVSDYCAHHAHCTVMIVKRPKLKH